METPLLSALELFKWRRQYLREYVRDSGFKTYMGDSPTDIIFTFADLQSGGRKITVPLVGRMKGNGVSGNERLGGNEEQLDQYSHEIQPEFYRNAIEVSKRTLHFNAADLMAVVRPLLREWCQERLKYRIIDQMHTVDGVLYAAASEAQKDAWLGRNADRVLFGALKSNNASNDHSASLANVDATDDKLTGALGRLAKRMARTGSPHIRPFKTGTQGREYYVMFCHPRSFRDLKADLETKNKDARPRDVDANPIFQDGDLIDDGVIYREIPEFEVGLDGTTNTQTTLAGAGASSVDVVPNFLCGAQALGIAWAQMPIPVGKREDDYGFFKNAGIEEAYGVSKLQRDETQIDHGMLTLYTAGSPDA